MECKSLRSLGARSKPPSPRIPPQRNGKIAMASSHIFLSGKNSVIRAVTEGEALNSEEPARQTR